MHRRRWTDLPPDLLHEISDHLHDPTDFVRFHAVCRSWRRSHEPTSARNTTSGQFLPWLLSPNEEDDLNLEFRCVFSKSSYLAPPPPTSGIGRNWVASADGTAVCYFTSNPLYGPTLHDPLTGTVLTHLPRFLDGQWEEENPNGIVLLYSKDGIDFSATAKVSAALLRPGDDEWTVIRRKLQSPKYGEFCVAYHGGKILVTVNRSFWLAIPVTTAVSSCTAGINDVRVLKPSSMPLDYGDEPDHYFYEYSHVLESRGELLWASVHINVDYRWDYSEAAGVRSLVGALMVMVHALEDDAPAMRWVRKNGVSLADRVFFLGWPNSFAVDAAQLGVAGGFAYFMFDNDKGRCKPHKRRGVFRCNLITNKTKFIQWLPRRWNDEKCTWLIPQPIVDS